MVSAGKAPCDHAAMQAASADPTCAGRGAWVLAATVLGSSMDFIDGTVVNVALPALQTDLHASGMQAQWVVVGYALFLSSLLLVGGALGDRLGLRGIFLAGVVSFAAASVWCGVAPKIGQLIAARCLQGVGGALLVPSSLALLSANFSDEQRGKAIGTWSGFASAMTALGPVLGGWLVQHGSWRWVFFVNVPVAMVAVWLVLSKVPAGPQKDFRSGLQGMDWTGAALATGGLSGVV